MKSGRTNEASFLGNNYPHAQRTVSSSIRPRPTPPHDEYVKLLSLQKNKCLPIYSHGLSTRELADLHSIRRVIIQHLNITDLCVFIRRGYRLDLNSYRQYSFDFGGHFCHIGGKESSIGNSYNALWWIMLSGLLLHILGKPISMRHADGISSLATEWYNISNFGDNKAFQGHIRAW